MRRPTALSGTELTGLLMKLILECFSRLYQSTARQRAAQARAAAEAAQEAERCAARRRLLEAARRNAGPEWHNAATKPLPVLDRSLMTPAQAWRGNGGRR